MSIDCHDIFITLINHCSRTLPHCLCDEVAIDATSLIDSCATQSVPLDGEAVVATQAHAAVDGKAVRHDRVQFGKFYRAFVLWSILTSNVFGIFSRVCSVIYFHVHVFGHICCVSLVMASQLFRHICCVCFVLASQLFGDICCVCLVFGVATVW